MQGAPIKREGMMQQVAPEKRQRLSSGQQVPQGGQGPNAGRGGQVVGPGVNQVRRIQQPSTPQQRQNGQKVPISQRFVKSRFYVF